MSRDSEIPKFFPRRAGLQTTLRIKGENDSAVRQKHTLLNEYMNRKEMQKWKILEANSKEKY